MKFREEISVHVSPAQVWEVLWDIERIARCLPGCEEARTIVPNERYEAVVRERVGPFTVRFPLEIHVLESEAPRRVRAQATGKDASMGSSLKVTFELSLDPAESGSRIELVADAVILGKLGSLGRGIISKKAHATIVQFAEAIRREVETGDQLVSE